MTMVSFVTVLWREVLKWIPLAATSKKKPCSSIHTKNKWVSCDHFYPHLVFKTFSLNFKMMFFCLKDELFQIVKTNLHVSTNFAVRFFLHVFFIFSNIIYAHICQEKRYNWVCLTSSLISQTMTVMASLLSLYKLLNLQTKVFGITIQMKSSEQNVCTVLNFLLLIHRKKLCFFFMKNKVFPKILSC